MLSKNCFFSFSIIQILYVLPFWCFLSDCHFCKHRIQSNNYPASPYMKRCLTMLFIKRYRFTDFLRSVEYFNVIYFFLLEFNFKEHLNKSTFGSSLKVNNISNLINISLLLVKMGNFVYLVWWCVSELIFFIPGCE